jgi:hypothetical protein
MTRLSSGKIVLTWSVPETSTSRLTKVNYILDPKVWRCVAIEGIAPGEKTMDPDRTLNALTAAAIGTYEPLLVFSAKIERALI